MEYVTLTPCAPVHRVARGLESDAAAGPGVTEHPRCNTKCVEAHIGRKVQECGPEADDAVVVVDCLGRICEWNPTAESLFGYPAATVIGRNFFQLISPRCSPPNADGAACHRRLCSTAGKTINILATRHSGDEIRIEMQTFSGCTKEEGGALLVVRDATAHGKVANRR